MKMGTARTLLAADIGGTRARFRHAGGVLELGTRDYPHIEALLAAVFGRLYIGPGADVVLAVAGPAQGGRARLTNLDWECDGAALRRRFGFNRLVLMNDLEAAAHTLAEQPPADAAVLHAGAAAGRQAVVSVSTGLGVAYWSRSGGMLHVEAAEAGHTGFAPGEAWEAEFLRALEAQHPGRVSWERVLSGAGLAALDAHLRQEPAASPAEVVQRARTGDEAAVAAVWRYSRLLGVFAGDLVLAAPAPGGVWLMGGVLAGLGALFDTPAFLQGFTAKGRLSPQLAQVPVRRTADDHLGLTGAWLTAEALAPA
ncbi:MAG TPA: ROK family protein [Gammaproteobacteria bacterium]